MAADNGNALKGIQLILEEMREDRRRADEDRKLADVDRKKADEDRRKADEDRRKADEDRRKADEDRRKADAAGRALRQDFRSVMRRLDLHLEQQRKRDDELRDLIKVIGIGARALVKKQDESLAILKQIARSLSRRGNGRGHGGNGK